MAEKIRLPEWQPDFGPAERHPTAGTVAIGARMPLVAYNINLSTNNLEIATKIAKNIRHINGGLRYVKAMSVTTMAIVNPYTSNIAVSKAVARAISYDYAEDLESLSGHMSARADISYKSKTQQSNYNTLHTIYANSIVKAKYVGVGNIYTKYEIMLHQLWDGVDFNSAYNEFYKEISNYMTLSRLNN